MLLTSFVCQSLTLRFCCTLTSTLLGFFSYCWIDLLTSLLLVSSCVVLGTSFVKLCKYLVIRSHECQGLKLSPLCCRRSHEWNPIFALCPWDWMKDGIKSSWTFLIWPDELMEPTMSKHCEFRFMQIADSGGYTFLTGCIQRRNSPQNSNFTFQCRWKILRTCFDCSVGTSLQLVYILLSLMFFFLILLTVEILRIFSWNHSGCRHSPAGWYINLGNVDYPSW